MACQLWDAGRRRELEELLGATGMGIEPVFWATARALAEVLPDGNRERTMLLGLTGNRDALTQAAVEVDGNGRGTDAVRSGGTMRNRCTGCALTSSL